MAVHDPLHHVPVLNPNPACATRMADEETRVSICPSGSVAQLAADWPIGAPPLSQMLTSAQPA
jgi:hypothetical protein